MLSRLKVRNEEILKAMQASKGELKYHQPKSGLPQARTQGTARAKPGRTVHFQGNAASPLAQGDAPTAREPTVSNDCEPTNDDQCDVQEDDVVERVNELTVIALEHSAEHDTHAQQIADMNMKLQRQAEQTATLTQQLSAQAESLTEHMRWKEEMSQAHSVTTAKVDRIQISSPGKARLVPLGRVSRASRRARSARAAAPQRSGGGARET
jgi:hypothetical protein